MNQKTDTIDVDKETDILDSDSCSDSNDIAGLESDLDYISESVTLDPRYKDLLENEEIVKRYGEDGREIYDDEEWINDLEAVKVTDRFGFVHKDGNIIETSELEKEKKTELSREWKWIDMIKEYDKSSKIPKKWRDRIWKGIPNKFRFQVWPKILNVDKYKKTSPYTYAQILERALVTCTDIKQIDLDINRTYRDHIAFKKRYDLKQKCLFNVLTAYAIYNTEVGYCQGMSQIAALFLMYMNEEDVFWCLHSLLVDPKWGMHGFFIPGFPSLMRYMDHFNKLVETNIKSLHKHIESEGIPTVYLTKWWFGCFLDRVPFNMALRLWDVFLLEGTGILVATGFTILKMHKKTLNKFRIEAYMKFIQDTLAIDFGFPINKVFEELRLNFRKLRKSNKLGPGKPGPTDQIEHPLKEFGQVMKRDIEEIKREREEIKSLARSSLSLAGRSPAVSRKNVNSYTPKKLNKMEQHKSFNAIHSNGHREIIPENGNRNLSHQYSSSVKHSRATSYNKTDHQYTQPSPSSSGNVFRAEPYFSNIDDNRIRLVKYGKNSNEREYNSSQYLPNNYRLKEQINEVPTHRHSIYDNVVDLKNDARVYSLTNNVTMIKLGDDSPPNEYFHQRQKSNLSTATHKQQKSSNSTSSGGFQPQLPPKFSSTVHQHPPGNKYSYSEAFKTSSQSPSFSHQMRNASNAYSKDSFAKEGSFKFQNDGINVVTKQDNNTERQSFV